MMNQMTMTNIDIKPSGVPASFYMQPSQFEDAQLRASLVRLKHMLHQRIGCEMPDDATLLLEIVSHEIRKNQYALSQHLPPAGHSLSHSQSQSQSQSHNQSHCHTRSQSMSATPSMDASMSMSMSMAMSLSASGSATPSPAPSQDYELVGIPPPITLQPQTQQSQQPQQNPAAIKTRNGNVVYGTAPNSNVLIAGSSPYGADFQHLDWDIC